MDDQATFEQAIAWFLDPATTDDDAMRRRLHDLPTGIWPAFSAEVAAELAERASRSDGVGSADLTARKRHLLGEERTRREPRAHHHSLGAALEEAGRAASDDPSPTLDG